MRIEVGVDIGGVGVWVCGSGRGGGYVGRRVELGIEVGMCEGRET